jgi:hypothetical protein
LAFNLALRATRPAGRQLSANTLGGILMTSDGSEFTYEHTFELTPDLYTEINSLFPPKKRWFRRAGILLFGFACFVSPYTTGVGVLLLLFFLIAMLVPQFLPVTTAWKFRIHRQIHGPTTYGLSHTRLWATGEIYEQNCAWGGVAVYKERGDWILISPLGLNPLYFRKSCLQEAGVYEAVAALGEARSNEHASQFPPFAKSKPELRKHV